MIIYRNDEKTVIILHTHIHTYTYTHTIVNTLGYIELIIYISEIIYLYI